VNEMRERINNKEVKAVKVSSQKIRRRRRCRNTIKGKSEQILLLNSNQHIFAASRESRDNNQKLPFIRGVCCVLRTRFCI